MSEIFSNADDCCKLARKFKKQLGDKIDFYGSINTPLPSGKYLSLYRRSNGEYFSYNCNCLPFYFKFAENGFLRIGVGSHSKDNSLGEKLAALSDFYEVLCEEYGEPTVFCTTKEDDEGLLTLQWSFINKEEEIAKFQNGTYFDDAEIDTLIVFGQKKDNIEGYDRDFASLYYIPIRFRNSGSRYDPFNIIFMRMYERLKKIDDVNDYGHQIHMEEYLYEKEKAKTKVLKKNQ